MREIKFRVWHPETEEMANWDDVQRHSIPYLFGYGSHELMQYAGLNDKNGVEIYEADIIIATTEEGEGVRGYIEYIDCAWMVNLDGITVYEFYKLRFPSIVVIGNINEKPSLLEEN